MPSTTSCSNATAPAVTYTLSLHDALPIFGQLDADGVAAGDHGDAGRDGAHRARDIVGERDHAGGLDAGRRLELDRKSTRLNSSHPSISYAVFCLKKKTLTAKLPPRSKCDK